MAKKSSGQDSRSLIAGIIGAIIIALAAFFGVDLSGIIDETEGDTGGEVIDNTGGGGDEIINNTGGDGSGATGDVTSIVIEHGFGASAGFWQVYFTNPETSDEDDPNGGIDFALAEAIDGVSSTLDIAAFEWNSPRLTEAVLAAHERGVRVRMVVDDEHTLEDDDSTIEELIDAGIPIVDDDRGGLMHNKFMIMDGSVVWMGSTNYTVNGSYRNNNNMLVMRARRAVEAYQAEFDEMFGDGEFGSSRSDNNNVSFTQDGIPVQVWFSPEDEVVPALLAQIAGADTEIRFMAFSFTLDEVGDAVMEAVDSGVTVSGIFETTGSETRFSEMPRFFCAGLNVLQDTSAGILHHKVFIIDDHTVITGSFNFSTNATERNDENMVIITDPNLVAQYVAEFERMMSLGRVPDGIEC